jgi:hypothetical protein
VSGDGVTLVRKLWRAGSAWRSDNLAMLSDAGREEPAGSRMDAGERRGVSDANRAGS